MRFIFGFLGVAAFLLSSLHLEAGSGTIFVADNDIYEFTLNNGNQSTFAQLGTPFGLAFDANGYLYTGDEDNGTVWKYAPNGTRTSFASGLNLPLGLAFDSFGNLLVANTDFGNPGSIYKYTPNGNRTTFASGLGTPVGLAFNSGNLFVADAGPGVIYKFSPTGVKSTFASDLSPNCLTFDTNGNLFETDETGNVYKFDPNGNRTTFASGLDVNGIVGLVFDGSGNLFVSNGNTITKITPAGSISTFASGLNMPNGLAFRPGVASPILKIGHSSPNTLVVSWSSSSANFILQTNSDLTTTNWNSAGFSPSTANGTNYSVAIPASGQNSFFRLEQ